MKKQKNNNVARLFQYPNCLSKSVYALISAYLIVIKNEECSSYPFLTQNFTIALISNGLMIYLLISTVYNLTKVLDRSYPWDKSYKKRIPYQLLLGVFIPLFPACLFATLYFYFQGTNILISIYFERYLAQLIVVLILLNFYLYHQRKRRNKQRPLFKYRLQQKQDETFPVN